MPKGTQAIGSKPAVAAQPSRIAIRAGHQDFLVKQLGTREANNTPLGFNPKYHNRNQNNKAATFPTSTNQTLPGRSRFEIRRWRSPRSLPQEPQLPACGKG